MNAVTLYDLESNLVALMDTEDIVPAEQQAEFEAEFIEALAKTVEKRDRVGQFLVHCEGQQATIDAEIKRLQALKKAYAKTQEKIEDYIVRTIQGFGTDEKGKHRKLEGRTTVFGIRACPSSVNVTDEGAIPAEYKTLTITVPATAWEAVADSLDIDERAKFLSSVKKCEVAVDKKNVKSAIESGRDVAGAALATGRYSLVRK
ncbi:MAG: siphovirus Gp157 family protein [Bryobacterales bacterium]|nr:siphovirus Gp157 family protein [Bryobacterales bacterium]